MAVGFAAAGARVVVCDVEENLAVETAQKITGDGGLAHAISCDVTQEAQVRSLVQQTVEHLGTVDVLVNNAGTNVVVPAEDMPLTAWDRVMNLNVTTPFLCAREASAAMIRQRWRRIINIASIYGIVAPSIHNSAAYCASKTALIGLTLALAADWAQHNVLVNAICPGLIATALTQSRVEDPEYRDSYLARVPLRRLGTAEDVVSTALYLASDASSYVTGQALGLDGGYTAV